ncbi:amidase family protein [Kribbella solani]|uniref:Amidase n=1 Tax=Kribbella solani TaxID=236067 RepID=A0A841E2T4_9ACTN|nr:amidase family protein [Kribbella solani]MBB5982707.1 amidase [Kribbella solani]
MSPLSCTERVDRALARIAEIGPSVNAICTLNPEARAQAAVLDAERAAGRVRGPLHGRLVVLKDNIDTAGLATTAGSLALAGIAPPAADAELVRRLYDAGCVIIGKANMCEWANYRGEGSTSGWSAYGGLTRNPYALGHSAGGSSAGSAAAVAAGLTELGIGTDTNGSIVCPASVNGVVGIRPTVGLIPTDGIVPLSLSQDTAGPMAPSVRQAAAALSVLSGRPTDYAAICAAANPTDLSGVRIGVPRSAPWGADPRRDRETELVLSRLSAAGATIIDDLALPVADYLHGQPRVDHEFKVGLEAYLRTRPDAPQTLEAVIAFNRTHADTELRYFGQDGLERAALTEGLDAPAYAASLETCLRLGRGGIDDLVQQNDLSALLLPGCSAAQPIDLENGDKSFNGWSTHAAWAGYPIVSVPCGMIDGRPVGVSFTGTAWTESTLVRVAHAYETLRAEEHGRFPEPELGRTAASPDVARIAFEGQSLATGAVAQPATGTAQYQSDGPAAAPDRSAQARTPSGPPDRDRPRS